MRKFIALFVLLLPVLAHAAGGLTPMPGKPAAADFALPDIDGKLHKLSDYRGKVVILNFWATWCPPCRREMPSMQRAWEQLKDKNVILLAVDVGEDDDQVFAYTAELNLTFPILFDRNNAVTAQWPVPGLPTTFVIDPQGRVVYRTIGGREWDESDVLEQVLALHKNN